MDLFECHIAVGGWVPLATPILNIISEYTAMPVPVEQMTNLIVRSEHEIKGEQWPMHA
jgi:hypothetical protein